METRGMLNSPSWDSLAAVALGPLRAGKQARERQELQSSLW